MCQDLSSEEEMTTNRIYAMDEAGLKPSNKGTFLIIHKESEMCQGIAQRKENI